MRDKTAQKNTGYEAEFTNNSFPSVLSLSGLRIPVPELGSVKTEADVCPPTGAGAPADK